MGSGYHGGFGKTKGSKSKKQRNIFTPIQFIAVVKVNGVEKDISRRVYQRNDINFDYIDPNTGESNLQRMLRGNAPYGNDGKPLELHHILQKEAGPMVEIHETTHKEYKRILHGLKANGESF